MLNLPFLVDELDLLNTNIAPMLSNTKTVGGNIFGNGGIVDDLLSGKSDDGLAMGAYDNIFAEGGLINNLADGHGVGAEYLFEDGTLLGNLDNTMGDWLF